MKILLIAIPNHHFFQWVNQLEESGYEVYWFDSTDGGSKVEKINWVRQIKGWKLRFDYPFRHFFKNKFPSSYKWVQKFNERTVDTVFEQLLRDIQPDIVHCFEMKLAGLPILKVMNHYKNVKFIYSSWGSDMFFFRELGVKPILVEQFLSRVDFLITDCKRDYKIAIENGYKNHFLGVYPGNGGIQVDDAKIVETNKRDTLLIKGYDDGVGKASVVLEALKKVDLALMQSCNIVIYSADSTIVERVEKDAFYKGLKIKIFKRSNFIFNQKVLEIMGESILHIGNSISDGMPNALLEAMGMGAFPIQSNPGKSSEDVIEDGVNGFLISDPMDSTAIASLIDKAINNQELRVKAQEYNVNFVQEKYNREHLKKEIIQLYQDVFLKE